MEICEICKQKFKTICSLSHHITRSHKLQLYNYYNQYIKKENEGYCLQCGNKTNFISLSKGYSKYCSNTCVSKSNIVSNKRKTTNLKRYGVENPQQVKEIKNKSKKTNLKKYGFENPAQSIIIKDKIKQTNLKRYGVDYIFQLNEVKEKTKETNLEKYGAECYSKTDIYKEKKKIEIIEKYRKEFPELNIIDYDINNSIMSCYCNECKQNYNINIMLLGSRLRHTNFKNPCTNCFPVNATYSNEEKELVDYIKTIYNGEIIENDKNILNGCELDIYLPDKKLAFEFDGLYWHSDIFKSKNAHLFKTESCNKLGIQLIHIFEDEWIFKQDIVKSKIKSLLGLNEKVYARKCICKKINVDICNIFLNKNYLDEYIDSKYRYGLYYNDELVCVMTFSDYRKDRVEILSFCNKMNVNVIGAASKLLKHFLENNKEVKEIIAYVDRRWSIGNLYKKLNFQLTKIIEPKCFYFLNKRRMKITNDKKYKKIYDCGYLKYIKV